MVTVAGEKSTSRRVLREATMDAREQRLARNEAVFRDINERVREMDYSLGVGEQGRQEFLCECADADCAVRIALSLGEYDDVRRSPLRFVVAPGHAQPDIERVVEENARYHVVEKTGLATAR
jgi:hypothetical protein